MNEFDEINKLNDLFTENSPEEDIFSMSVDDMLLKLSRGNPGAVVALLMMMENSTKIDPQAWSKDMHPLLQLFELNIKGSHINVFLRDTCSCDLVTVFAMFRAVQLGFLPLEELKTAIYNATPVPNCAELVSKVRASIPQFGNFPEA